MALIRTAAEKANVPFLNIVQACTIEPSWRLPDENELRWLAYTTMAYGGRVEVDLPPGGGRLFQVVAPAG